MTQHKDFTNMTDVELIKHIVAEKRFRCMSETSELAIRLRELEYHLNTKRYLNDTDGVYIWYRD